MDRSLKLSAFLYLFFPEKAIMYKNNSSGIGIEGSKKCYVFQIILNNYILAKYIAKLFAILFTYIACAFYYNGKCLIKIWD